MIKNYKDKQNVIKIIVKNSHVPMLINDLTQLKIIQLNELFEEYCKFIDFQLDEYEIAKRAFIQFKIFILSRQRMMVDQIKYKQLQILRDLDTDKVLIEKIQANILAAHAYTSMLLDATQKYIILHDFDIKESNKILSPILKNCTEHTAFLIEIDNQLSKQ